MEISLAKVHADMSPTPIGYGDEYPSVYLRFNSEDPELPKDGVMTVRFCVTRKSVATRNGEVEVEYNVDLKDILSVKAEKSPEKKSAKLPSASEALDKLRKEYEEED